MVYIILHLFIYIAFSTLLVISYNLSGQGGPRSIFIFLLLFLIDENVSCKEIFSEWKKIVPNQSYRKKYMQFQLQKRLESTSILMTLKCCAHVLQGIFFKFIAANFDMLFLNWNMRLRVSKNRSFNLIKSVWSKITKIAALYSKFLVILMCCSL